MNRNNKIFQIIISIVALGIAFLLLLCIGICSPKTVVRKAVVDADGHSVPPPDICMELPGMSEQAAPLFTPVEIASCAMPMISGAFYAYNNYVMKWISNQNFVCIGTLRVVAYDELRYASPTYLYMTPYMTRQPPHFVATGQVGAPKLEKVDFGPQLTNPDTYIPFSVKTPVTPRLPDAYNKQLQSYIYYSRANESDTDILQLSAVTGLFILNIIMMCNLVYIIERPPRH